MEMEIEMVKVIAKEMAKATKKLNVGIVIRKAIKEEMQNAQMNKIEIMELPEKIVPLQMIIQCLKTRFHPRLARITPEK